MESQKEEKKVITIMLSAFERDESDENTTSGMDKLRKIFNRQDLVIGVEFEHNGKTYKILDLWD